MADKNSSNSLSWPHYLGIWGLIGFILTLVIIDFWSEPDARVISPEIIILVALAAALFLSTHFDKISVAKVFALERRVAAEVQEKQKAQERVDLLLQTVMNVKSNSSSNNNIRIGFARSGSDDECEESDDVVEAEDDSVGSVDENGENSDATRDQKEDGVEHIGDASESRRSKTYGRPFSLSQQERRVVEHNAILNYASRQNMGTAQIKWEIQLEADDVNRLSNRSHRYDALIAWPDYEEFVEVKLLSPQACASSFYSFRMRELIESQLNLVQSFQNKSGRKAVLTLIFVTSERADAEKARVNVVHRLARYFEPSIVRDLLRIELVTADNEQFKLDI